MNSRVVGPAVASILVLGVVGGAVAAQVTADRPAKPVYVAPAALSCPTSPAPISPGADPTGTATLVPPLAVSGQLCDYGNGSPTATKLGAREIAAIIAGINGGHSVPSTEPVGLCDTAGTAGSLAAVPQHTWVVQLRYGVRPDVAVVISQCGDTYRAVNGIAKSTVSENAIVPTPASTEEPVVPSEETEEGHE